MLLQKETPDQVALLNGTLHRTPEGGVVFEPTAAKPPREPDGYTTVRQVTQRDAELEAGRAAVARAAETESKRKALVKSRQEIAAEGTNTPVLRPADFREYAPIQAPATSKDGGSRSLQPQGNTPAA